MFSKVFKAVFGVGAAILATGTLVAVVIGIGVAANDWLHKHHEDYAYERGLQDACADSPANMFNRMENGCLLIITEPGRGEFVYVDGKWRALGAEIERAPLVRRGPDGRDYRWTGAEWVPVETSGPWQDDPIAEDE